MYAIITACIFDLQMLGDLMMCILFYNDQQEHELEYKEKIHLRHVYTMKIMRIECELIRIDWIHTEFASSRFE